MLRKLREARENDEGFTLIELLVVVIIIGILAAIAIPVFLNQRENGWRAAAESDVRNAALGVESFLTRTTAYPASATDLTDNAATAMDGDAVETSNQVTLTYTLRATGANAGTYCIAANNANISSTTVDAYYDSAAGGLQKPLPGDTSCPV